MVCLCNCVCLITGKCVCVCVHAPSPCFRRGITVRVKGACCEVTCTHTAPPQRRHLEVNSHVARKKGGLDLDRYCRLDIQL